MPPSERYAASPASMATLFRRHRRLLAQMLTRDVAQRYRGSALGMLWSFLTPLLMLAVYTVVFSVVFEARWASRGAENAQPQTGEFALILFCGLLLHTFLADCLTRSPQIVLGNANFVKKVIFPLEILPVTVVGSAGFHFLVGLVVLLAAQLIVLGTIPVTALLFPLAVAPLAMCALGAAWLLASAGVYLRDIGQLMGLCMTVLLFLSPVFYPPEALPEAWRPYLVLNPLTVPIESLRAVLLWGRMPQWDMLGAYTCVAAVMMWLGFAWFQKTRKGFADVV